MADDGSVDRRPSLRADVGDDAQEAGRQAVEAVVRPAPHGLRLAAFAVDGLLVAAVVAVVPATGFAWLPLAVFVVYHTLGVWLLGHTIGKALFGLRVERISRRPTGLLWACGRSSIGYFGVNLLGFGTVGALFNAPHQTPNDKVFRSVVVLPGNGDVTVSVLAQRLSAYAERHARAQEDKGIADTRAAWGSVKRLATGLGKTAEGLSRWGGTDDGALSGSSGAGNTASVVVRAMSLRAASATLAATTAVTGATVQNVEPVQSAVERVATTDDAASETSTALQASDDDSGDAPEVRRVASVAMPPLETSAEAFGVAEGETVYWGGRLSITASHIPDCGGNCVEIAVADLAGRESSVGSTSAQAGWSEEIAGHRVTLGAAAYDEQLQRWLAAFTVRAVGGVAEAAPPPPPSPSARVRETASVAMPPPETSAEAFGVAEGETVHWGGRLAITASHLADCGGNCVEIAVADLAGREASVGSTSAQASWSEVIAGHRVTLASAAYHEDEDRWLATFNVVPIDG